MDTNEILVHSIENVKQLIDNSIMMLRDLDRELSKFGFEPINGNALATETSKSIHQSSSQYATFFPQYMGRPYALKADMDTQKVKKIIFVNIQIYHAEYKQLSPSLISSVIILPETSATIKNDVKSWWVKNIAFEYSNFEDLKKNGEINEIIDEGQFKNIFWCNNLVKLADQQSIAQEAKKLVDVFNNVS